MGHIKSHGYVIKSVFCRTVILNFSESSHISGFVQFAGTIFSVLNDCHLIVIFYQKVAYRTTPAAVV